MLDELFFNFINTYLFLWGDPPSIKKFQSWKIPKETCLENIGKYV